MVNYLYDVDVAHHRQNPVVHQIHQRSYLWFVDVDHLPHIPLLARFDSADHCGDPARSIRQNTDTFLAEHGVDLDGGSITMLTQARSLGYVFNPLSLFWCHSRSGSLVCVVAEVHNTYRERHRYLLFPDERGSAVTDKAFYVSPFYPVDGFYRMSVPEPGEQVAISITLHRPEDRPFTTSVRGARRPARLQSVLSTALRQPLATYRVRGQIARHGIRLYLKGLPVMPRPSAPQPAGVGSKVRDRRGAAAALSELVRQVTTADLPVAVRAWDGSKAGPSVGPVVVIKSRRALRRMLASPGELGFARAFVSGDLDVEGDLIEGFRTLWEVARSRERSGPISLRWRTRLQAALLAARLGAVGLPPKPPVSEARLSGRLHTRARDRAAIAHHYDLSNEFYELLLDDTMSYSSAYYRDPGQELVDAQRAKLDLICRKLDLRPGLRLLDVGCGWGSLILHAASNYGVEAVGVTLSAQQRDFVTKRIADRGLTELVSVQLCDYRDLDRQSGFDAVSSIEMGEHVGQEQYPEYAAALLAALRPGARLLLQQMSRRADAAPGGGAFIESYIAPDMHMRPLAATVGFLETAGFEVADVESLRQHYVHTANAWLTRLEERQAEFAALVGEEVVRVWRLYLAGGAVSFEQGRMGVDQILAVRPPLDGRAAVPLRRDWVSAPD
jgi:cyclopropane fatty-acyl-phospholipid synthase-like methyltransferase/DUF1365 family protein